MNLREAFTNELALEAKARDAEDVALGAQLKELRTILAQELETLGKACTEELAGEATTRDVEDTADRVLLEELQASIADIATQPWCEEQSSVISGRFGRFRLHIIRSVRVLLKLSLRSLHRRARTGGQGARCGGRGAWSTA